MRRSLPLVVMLAIGMIAACAADGPHRSRNVKGDDLVDDDIAGGGPTQAPGEELPAPNEAPPTDPPPAQNADGTWLDPDGVQMKHSPNTQGSAWRLGTKDPKTDPEVVLRFAEKVDKNTDFWTATAESGGDLTFRININVTASQGDQEDDHAKLAATGYMVSPKDLKNLEMTGYFRVHDVNDPGEAIATKVRGGQHSGNNDPRAACIGLLVEYTDDSMSLWEKELFHPSTPKAKVNRLITHGNLVNKWVGVKTIVYNIDNNTKVVSQSWIDTDPFDAAGKPGNHWQKVFDYVDKDPGFGGRVVTWGGKFATWRIDAAKTIDFKLLSVHEITPPAQ